MSRPELLPVPPSTLGTVEVVTDVLDLEVLRMLESPRSANASSSRQST